jgi:16S rRNA (adenine1518-N6/adenine1519-N6)-dimethyltransferase
MTAHYQKGALEPRAKKSLGQNFLQDDNIARKIVDALAVTPQDQILEIGPGPGALSGIIQARKPARIVLVEKDCYWARERMREGRTKAEEFARFRGGEGKQAFAVILADALDMPWERFSTPWKIIGNLPYNVASPLMWDIFSRVPGLTRAVFMIQKEVGQRIIASPGTSAYGALSVWVQSHMRAKLEFIVPPQVFRPRPKVDSAVLSFEPHGLIPSSGGRVDFAPEALTRTLKLCFQMRRKQLGTILRANGADPGALESLGIVAQARPENLAPAEFHRLARTLFPGGK